MKKLQITLFAAILAFAGCSAKGTASDSYAPASGGYNSAANGYGSYMSEPGEYFAEDAKEESIAPEPAAIEETDPVLTSEKLVYNGSLTVQTLKYEDTVNSVRSFIHQKNGIIEYEYEYDTNYNWYYTADSHSGTKHLNLTIRIPTEYFEEFLNAMDGYGKVTSKTSTVENITRRYNDVTVQIEALQIQQDRLLEMMDKAETIEDMILVEQRLTEVQTQLNSYKNMRESMDTDVKYSTITMTVDEVKEYNDTHPNFFQQIGEAFVDGFKSFFYNAEDFLIALVYALPYLIIFGLVLFFLIKKNFFAKLRNFHPFRRKRRDPLKDTENKEIL